MLDMYPWLQYSDTFIVVKAIFTSADSERSEKSKKKIVFAASDTVKSLQKEQSNESIKTNKEQNLVWNTVVFPSALF